MRTRSDTNESGSYCSISTVREVADALDLLRAGVLGSVKDLEAQLAVVEAESTTLSA